jgi:AcrR family transcriptional regulator
VKEKIVSVAHDDDVLELDAPKRVRGPNAVRRAATREKLIETTIRCLYEYGYHPTSTVLVAKEACVSRGAMLHQFPTKVDLMIAVADAIMRARGDVYRAELPPRDGDPRERFLAVLDVMWGEMIKPAGVALIEIEMATRSDKTLAKRFDALTDESETTKTASYQRSAERMGINDPAAIAAFVQLQHAAITGLSVEALYKGKREKIESALELMRQYQSNFLDGLIAASKKS